MHVAQLRQQVGSGLAYSDATIGGTEMEKGSLCLIVVSVGGEVGQASPLVTDRGSYFPPFFFSFFFCKC